MSYILQFRHPNLINVMLLTNPLIHFRICFHSKSENPFLRKGLSRVWIRKSLSKFMLQNRNLTQKQNSLQWDKSKLASRTHPNLLRISCGDRGDLSALELLLVAAAGKWIALSLISIFCYGKECTSEVPSHIRFLSITIFRWPYPKLGCWESF